MEISASRMEDVSQVSVRTIIDAELVSAKSRRYEVFVRLFLGYKPRMFKYMAPFLSFLIFDGWGSQSSSIVGYSGPSVESPG